MFAFSLRLELEGIGSVLVRLEAIAIRLEAIGLRLEANARRLEDLMLVSAFLVSMPSRLQQSRRGSSDLVAPSTHSLPQKTAPV